jgi:hypothetical protein
MRGSESVQRETSILSKHPKVRQLDANVPGELGSIGLCLYGNGEIPYRPTAGGTRARA